MRAWAVGLLLLLAPLADAQQAASLGTDYARAMAYIQGELNKRDAEQKIRDAKTAGEISGLKDQLAAAQKALKDLAAAAPSDPNAQKALTAFAEGNGQQGVDALLAEAAGKARAGAAQTKQAAEDYKRAGALAFAVDTNKALAAYEQALALAPDDLVARNEFGHLKRRRGDLAGAETAYRAVLAGAGADKSWQAAALGNLGIIALTRGDLAAAEDSQKRALVLFTELGGKQGQAASLSNLGEIARLRADLTAAEDYQRRALALNTDIGSKEGQAANLGNLGIVASLRGDLGAAEDYYKRGLALDNELGRKEGQAAKLGNLGIIASKRGDLAAAEDYQKRSLALEIELGHKEGEARTLNNLGALAFARGKTAEACAYYRQALTLYEGMGAAQNAGIVRSNIAKFCPR